ncbi:MAG TPA: hypothetical protein VHU40_16575 [Polyangia bacterium]|nr:hypothetical protein [Polyangia bacterium]
MNTMKPTRTTLVACLLVLAGGAAGCDTSGLCGDHYHDGYAVRCESSGSAKLVAPAHFGLPGTIGVDRGGSCLDDQGGCTNAPYVGFDSNPSDDGSVPRPRLTVQLFFSQSMPATTIVLAPERADVFVNAQLFTNATTRESLQVVDGTITTRSTSPEQLDVTVALTLRVPSTGETLTLSNAQASASCDLEAVRICDDGLGVPYGSI